MIGLCLALCLATSGGAQEALEIPVSRASEDLIQQDKTVERSLVLPAAARQRLARAEAEIVAEPPVHFEVKSGKIEAKATLFSESFETTFPDNRWSLFTLGSAEVTWGTSSHQGPSSTAWSAGSGPDFPGHGGTVPPDSESWMIAGPFDLRDRANAELAFDLWLDTETEFDNFLVAASLDGESFTAFGRGQTTNGWLRIHQDLSAWGSLGQLTGNAEVYFAFIYQSDGSNAFEGAYVDNLTLTVATKAGLNLTINQLDKDDCPTVEAVVSVTDNQGDPIQGLTEMSFTVEEDGVTETFTSTTAGGGGKFFPSASCSTIAAVSATVTSATSRPLPTALLIFLAKTTRSRSITSVRRWL
jgi:hypothetical protein